MDDKKHFICAMPKAGTVNTGWNFDGKKAGQGGDIIPYHLNLTYIAYAEKKFYNVKADLPANKILKAFQKGFSVKGDPDDKQVRNIEHGTYNTLTLGVAPGGVIVVWLSADHHRLEICRLQAKEVFVDRNNFYENSQERSQQEFFDVMYAIQLSKDAQNGIKENGIPFGLWDKYRERFKYRFKLQSYDDKDKFIWQSQKYFNGEANLFYPKELEKNEYLNAGIPFKVNLSFTRYSTSIIFNDEEMLSVFQDLQKRHPDKPMDVLVIPTFMYSNYNLSVQCQDDIIPLKRFEIK